MRKKIEKQPIISAMKLYRQAWVLFDRNLITKEEYIKRLEEINR